MVIAVDIDNVLNDLAEQVLVLYNRDSGDHLQIGDIYEYSMESYVKPDMRQCIESYFVAAVPMTSPRKGSQKYLSRLVENGHEVYAVTSTLYTAMDCKAAWVMERFPFIDEAHIVRLPRKQLFRCDVMIDDYHMNLLGGEYEKILLDYAWNQCVVDSTAGIRRAKSWKQIYQIINKIEEGARE